MLQYNSAVFNKFNSRSTSSIILSELETRILLFRLGQTYARSEYPKYCLRIRDCFSLCRENHPTFQFWNRNNLSLSNRNSKKCRWNMQYSQYHHAKISISATCDLYQRYWGKQISNEIETSEQFHLIQAFKNGGTEFITEYSPEERLHVQLDLNDAYF